MNEGDNLTPLGVTNYRNTNQRFGINDNDRLQHIYVIGKSGTGKSTLLKNMAISDIQRGNGLCVIDPHADIATALFKHIPEYRKQDLIYFNPKDADNPIAFNPLHNISESHHHLVASGLVNTFHKIWADSWGVRMEYILRFALLTLLNYPKASLLDIQPLLTQKEFRVDVLKYITDKAILDFWKHEFEQYTPKFRTEVIAPILNKVGIFQASLLLRRIVGTHIRGLVMSEIMDTRKILICNLSKGELGEEVTAILGSMLITAIQNAAMYRAKQEEGKRVPFYLYIDESHVFMTLSFCSLLSEARKFKLSLFIIHQYIEQLDERIRKAIFGNIGTIISFRVGAADAEYLAKEFYPIFKETDFIHLPRYAMYLKLMIDGTTSQPFSAKNCYYPSNYEEDKSF